MATQPANAQDLAWQALADDFAPVKSLTRLDAATARVVTNVTVVGALLTGLTLLGSNLPSVTGAARGLAITAMLLAASAVITALSAQILTVTQISTGDLLAVEAWYRRRINIRGPLTVAATVLLVAAAGASTVAAGLALLGIPDQPPTIAITRTTPLQTNSATSARPQAVGAVTAEVTFPWTGSGRYRYRHHPLRTGPARASRVHCRPGRHCSPHFDRPKCSRNRHSHGRRCRGQLDLHFPPRVRDVGYRINVRITRVASNQ